MTQYKKRSFREEAPFFADCLTTVWYVFKQAMKVDLPVTFIGDMPRKLFSFDEWKVLTIDRKEARCGDILFVKKRGRSRLLSHVAIVLGADLVFHCCMILKRAVVQTDRDFFLQYHQKIDGNAQVRYIDYRNETLRQKQKDAFISEF